LGVPIFRFSVRVPKQIPNIPLMTNRVDTVQTLATIAFAMIHCNHGRFLPNPGFHSASINILRSVCMIIRYSDTPCGCTHQVCWLCGDDI
jgi:hypothetical protein